MYEYNNVYFVYFVLKAGKLKSYEFGKLFRKRYTQFLPVAYNSSQFHIRSTEFDRTEMTASVFLAGLFPPQSNQIWNKDLLWSPVPIYSISPNEDDVSFKFFAELGNYGFFKR